MECLGVKLFSVAKFADIDEPTLRCVSGCNESRRDGHGRRVVVLEGGVENVRRLGLGESKVGDMRSRYLWHWLGAEASRRGAAVRSDSAGAAKLIGQGDMSALKFRVFQVIKEGLKSGC